jgi:hypothetical protein
VRGRAAVVTDVHQIHYVIEVHRKGGCCETHPTEGWYEAKLFRGILRDASTSADYAEKLLDRARADAPKADYRLVEIEEVHRVTKQVIA